MKHITPRGWFVFGILAAVALWFLVLVSANLWWVGIDSPKAEILGWCWGLMTECVPL
jgi:hypothetical protein